MKKKKFGSYIIFITFILSICFSLIWWTLPEKNTKIENYENREMTQKPKFSDGYNSFFSAYDNYFNDHMPFRNNLITLNTFLDYFLFDKSSNENVIIGKQGWLFYADKDDGDPVSCYKGTNLLSEEDLSTLAQNCIRQKEYLEQQGKEFVIFIAPNKERIYYDMMPARYGSPATQYQTLQIIEYLRQNTDIRVVYPYAELMEAKNNSSENIYYKTDTHWNYLGGYIGSYSLLKELGINIPKINRPEITIEKTTDSHIGDLTNMLHLGNYLKPCEDYSVNGFDSHQIKKIKWDLRNELILHAQNADQRKLYVIRDSFASQMSLYVGSQFNYSYWKYLGTYTQEDLENQNPDIVVYETVERYVYKLATFSLAD